jgi:hypothetical protein
MSGNTTNHTIGDVVGLPIPLHAQWAIYVVLNYLGAFLCTLALIALVSNAYFNVPNGRKSRHAMHVANGALLSGCWIMSVPCATQSLLNWIYDRNTAEFGEVACKLEAYFRMVAIITQFYSNALIAAVPLFTTITMRDVRPVVMLQLVGLVWMGSTFLTLLATIGTHVSVQPAGAYCFPDFDSNMIRFWFAPSMLIALAFQTTSFVLICRGADKISKQANFPTNHPPPNTTTRAFAVTPSPRTPEKQHRILRRLIRNAATTELIFFVGWFPAIVAFCYALDPANDNHITIRLDIGLAIPGSLHSVLVPMWLFYSQEGMRRWLCTRKRLNQHNVDEHKMLQTLLGSSRRAPIPSSSPRSGAQLSMPTHSQAVVVRPTTPRNFMAASLDSPLSIASSDHSSGITSFVVTPPSVSSPRPKVRYRQTDVPPHPPSDGGSPRPQRSPRLLDVPSVKPHSVSRMTTRPTETGVHVSSLQLHSTISSPA